MILYKKHFVVFVTVCCIVSCREAPTQLRTITGERIAITDSLVPVDSLESFITPYRNRVNQILDSTISYAPYPITKSDGQWNTTAGNLMADIVLEQANPVFNKRTGKTIDFVLLNHGGIRSIISPGPVTARTAYEIMPFENQIAVTRMDGPAVRALVRFLIRSKRAHPTSGMKILLDQNSTLQSVHIQGKPFNEARRYYVATSDYLLRGGDDMGFFKDGDTAMILDYKIRNAIIDYFRKVDTLKPKVDNRFTQLN